MARIDNWPRTLNALIEERRAASFAWGAHDCCLFAADGVRATTGADPAADLRGRYRTALGAARLIRRRFAGDIEAIPSALGFAEIPPALARRGDVVSYRLAAAIGNRLFPTALGICVGADCAFAGPAGLTFMRAAACRRAWRI